MGHDSRAEYMRDVTLKNLDIVHVSLTACLLEPGEDMILENVRFERVHVLGDPLTRQSPHSTRSIERLTGTDGTMAEMCMRFLHNERARPATPRIPPILPQ